MMQFKPAMMVGGAVLCLAAFEPATLLAKVAYALVGAAAGACVADPLNLKLVISVFRSKR